MSRAPRSALPLLVVFVSQALFLSALAGEPKKHKEALAANFAKLERGMTLDQVRQLLGPPKHIARQILYHRYREQWTYEAPLPVQLTFECLRGQKPQLLFPTYVAQKN